MLQPADYVTSYLPTAQDVRDFVNHADVEPGCYAELLNYDLTAKNAMPDGTNNVSAFVESCEITNNASSDAPRSVSLVLDGQIEQYIDWTVDKLRVSRIYTHHGAVVLGPIPRGVFGFQQPQIDRLDHGESTIEIEGQDDLFNLSQIDFMNDYDIPRGIDIALVIATILKMDMYRPNEGGRTPSGTAVAGGLGPGAGGTGGGGGAADYTMMGVLATSVTTFNSGTGLYESADHGLGVVRYSPYDKAHCDPSTFAPISPKDGRPMVPSQLFLYGWWNDTALGLFFKPSTGEFSIPCQSVSQIQVVDPYKNAPIYGPYPSGFRVKQVNPSSVLTSIGSLLPPLATWPRDYDGSGPYYVNTTAQTVTTTGSGLVSTLTGQPVSGHFLLAERTGMGRTVLIPVGTYYAVTPGGGTTDAANPSTIWQTPPTSLEYNVAAFGGGWAWSGGVWTVTLALTNTFPFSGTGFITCTVYERDNIGNYISRGTLSTSPSSSSGHFSCSGTVGSFTPATSSTIALALQLHVTEEFTQTSTDEALMDIYGAVNAGFPAPNLPPASSYTDYGNPASGLTPNASGVNVPWPDTNDPGQCPSGCYTVGPNIPASRLDLPNSLGNVLATMPQKRGVKELAAILQLCDMANAYHLYQDETGQLTTRVKPYFTDDGAPTAAWNFSNIENAPDGELLSFRQRLADQTAIANITVDFSLGQGTSGGIFAERTNDDPSSITSRAHMHRPITSIQQNDAIQTQSALDSIADNHIQEVTSSIQAADIVIACMPFLQTYDAIGITYVDTDTGDTIVDSGDFPFIVTSWTESLKSADGPVDTISLTAERVVVFN